MNRNASLPVVCREYEALLHRCKACMEECRKVSEQASTMNDEVPLGRGVLARLFQEYERSYANLKHHFGNCARCQTTRKRQQHSSRAIV